MRRELENCQLCEMFAPGRIGCCIGPLFGERTGGRASSEGVKIRRGGGGER